VATSYFYCPLNAVDDPLFSSPRFRKSLHRPPREFTAKSREASLPPRRRAAPREVVADEPLPAEMAAEDLLTLPPLSIPLAAIPRRRPDFANTAAPSGYFRVW